ncbi:MAG: hemerythrin domain-containing protein [Acidobacteria bacterium]|nr:hemerythrin domain-containing protein [Acidobacteriota bacterium]
MKRHESLVPLSRDHHFGLIMAQQLILGRATNPRADWPTDRTQQVPRLIKFFESDLRPHFDIEEAHVFPAADRSVTGGGRQVRSLLADHDAMRAMIRGLEADPVAELDERLPAFGHLLKAHIHKEERQLFEQMQAACAPAELEALGARVAAAHDAAEPACEV